MAAHVLKQGCPVHEHHMCSGAPAPKELQGNFSNVLHALVHHAGVQPGLHP